MNMAHQATPSSQKALMMELKSLQEQPVEGFRITLVEESDLYNWEVAIFGPPNTLYEGGYFKVGEICTTGHIALIIAKSCLNAVFARLWYYYVMVIIKYCYHIIMLKGTEAAGTSWW